MDDVLLIWDSLRPSSTAVSSQPVPIKTEDSSENKTNDVAYSSSSTAENVGKQETETENSNINSSKESIQKQSKALSTNNANMSKSPSETELIDPLSNLDEIEPLVC